MRRFDCNAIVTNAMKEFISASVKTFDVILPLIKVLLFP